MRFQFFLVASCFLAVTTATSAQVVPPKAAQPQPGQTNLYPPALYRMNDVSKSLNLNRDQITKLNKLTEQTQARYGDDYRKLNSLTGAQRVARAQELNNLYSTDWNKSAGDIFNANQRTRYQQLNHQYFGFNSLYDQDVQKRLGLTPAQVAELREHSDWSNQQWQEINRMAATDPTKATQLYNDYWKQRERRFNKYLTTEQQRTWLKMTGVPYKFQPSFAPSR